MSEKENARRAETQVVISGTDISVYVNKALLSLTYTDNEEDAADDLQIKVHDRDGKWLKKWLNTVISNAAQGGEVISTAPTSSSSSSSSETTKYMVADTTGVCVRRGAGEKYKIIGKLSYGTLVDVYGFYSKWAKISYSGGVGFCKGTFTEVTTTATSSTTASSSSSASSSKGLKISAAIVSCNDSGDGKDVLLDCGEFELDSIDAQGPPATITIKATSLSYNNTIRQTKKSKSWENFSLSEIAATIAQQNKMGCLFESGYNPKYSRVEQYQMSDISFLQKLCHDAGCSLKATNNIIVIFDQAAYESKSPILKIKYGESGKYLKYKLTTGSNDCYTSCRVSYTNADGTTITATEYAENYKADSDNQQCLEIRQKVSSISEAQTLAHKMLRLHNKYEVTGSFTFQGNPKLFAGNTVELSDFGFGDGKYIISQAKHSISSSGYTTQIEIRKCLESESTTTANTVNDSELDDIAMQVIRGDWDNGAKRRELLETAGYDYEQVQGRVNQILYGG